ncbi:hypothetical protein ZWY2020_005892 [Hordeum vulgare]|nr:hypothetical protein ZWY2020_005892 [Hordeum vulgare]
MTQMEQLVQQCDMEVMKMAMLKHEQTFRQQAPVVIATLPSASGAEAPAGAEPAAPADDDEDEHAGAGRRLATPPSGESEDELELTLAVGGRVNRRRRDGATPSTTGCSGRRSLQTPSSSTDSDEALRTKPHRRQRATACDLREGSR